MFGIDGQLAHKLLTPEAVGELTRDALRTMRTGFASIIHNPDLHLALRQP
jgi:hypothetical protein